MAGADRKPVDPLADQLVEEGNHFSFYQAVRLIHALDPEAPKLGFQGPVEREWHFRTRERVIRRTLG